MSLRSERTPPTAGGANPLGRYGLNAYVRDESIVVRTTGPRSDLMTGSEDDYRSLVALLERETARVKSEIVGNALAGKLGDIRAIKHFHHFERGGWRAERFYGYGGRDISPTAGVAEQTFPDTKRDLHLVALASEAVIGKGLAANPEVVPPVVVFMDGVLAAVREWISEGGLKRACRVAALREAPAGAPPPRSVVPLPVAPRPNVVGDLTQDRVRLSGSVCTAPQDHEAEGSKVWAWDYYRPAHASRLASRVTVNLNPDGSGLAASFHCDLDGTQRMAAWKPIAAGEGIDAALRFAAEGIENLNAVAPAPWECSRGRAALFDAGFHDDENEGNVAGTSMIRTGADGMFECVEGLVEYHAAETGELVSGRRDIVDGLSEAVDVMLFDPETMGRTQTRCADVADAIDLLDRRLLPTPRTDGIVSFERDDLGAPAPGHR